MNDLVLAGKAADWYKLKALVLNSVSSPITRRVYNMALDEFMVWFPLEPRPGFSKATVSIVSSWQSKGDFSDFVSPWLPRRTIQNRECWLQCRIENRPKKFTQLHS